MNILVIGNGFDLAHGLPTTYNNFLNFIKDFTSWDANQFGEDNKSYSLDIGKYDYFFQELFVEANMSDDENSKMKVEEIKNLTTDNIWIQHFDFVQIKQGWIDFESEISRIIQALDEAREIAKRGIRAGKNFGQLEQYHIDILFNFLPNGSSLVDLGAIERTKQRLIHDLNDMIRCLEIYLSDFVNNMEVEHKIPDIEKIEVDKVLSFNYTNTYERIYAKENNHIDYDFIHGKAEINHDVDTCNLVLGIDEYLIGDARNNDNEFIQFKKFYQRIYKKTGCEYIDWLNHVEYDIEDYVTVPNLKIYILGHSLDVTDKDILARLINAEGAKTTIFYHDRDALDRQIANLVKVIGQNELISRVHGLDASIIFKEQGKDGEL